MDPLFLHSQKPLILLVPLTNRSASYQPSISLSDKNRVVYSLSHPHNKSIKMNRDAPTDLQRISSWSATAGIRCPPAGCHNPTACFPRWWSARPAGRVCRVPRSSGTGPGGPRLLQGVERRKCLCHMFLYFVIMCWTKWEKTTANMIKRNTCLHFQTYERGWESSTVSSVVLDSF